MIGKTADSLLCPFHSIQFLPLVFLPLWLVHATCLPGIRTAEMKPYTPLSEGVSNSVHILLETSHIKHWRFSWSLFVSDEQTKSVSLKSKTNVSFITTGNFEWRQDSVVSTLISITWIKKLIPFSNSQTLVLFLKFMIPTTKKIVLASLFSFQLKAPKHEYEKIWLS